jgi:glycosyltransferase involved in cell wall biosynthesis
MLNLEVNAGGTPVIAYKSGGVLETVIDGKTGILFEKPNIKSLISALKRFDELIHRIKPEDCIRHAEKFSPERFRSEIEKFINAKLKVQKSKQKRKT